MSREVIRDEEETKPYIHFSEDIELPYRFHGPRECRVGYYDWVARYQEFVVLVSAGGGYYSAFTYTIEEVAEHMGKTPAHKFYDVTFRKVVYREEVPKPQELCPGVPVTTSSSGGSAYRHKR